MDPDETKTTLKLQALSKVLEMGDSQQDTVRADEKVYITQTNYEKEEKNGKNVEDPVIWDNSDFETAISATGYGKYNVLIMATSVFPMLSCVFASSTMSLILPSAECDLNLTNFHKGILNASTYTGMILSAFIWGFLSDTLGRQKLIVISFALDALLNLTASLSQSFEVLLTAKLSAGFICSGPFAILMTYLAECHSAEHRASIIQWTGVFSAFGTVILPLLAWIVIPQPWSVSLFGGMIFMPSWRLFLVICTIPAIVSAISFYFQYESPKFLMTQGKHEEALEVFRSIYAHNKGLPPSTYPVRSLLPEKIEEKKDPEEEDKSCLHFFSAGWAQVKPLFFAPHLGHAMLVFLFQGGTLFGHNTIRLWMPALFSSILANEHLSQNVSSVCQLLTPQEEPEIVTIKDCTTHLVDGQVYVNAVVIGVVTAMSYLISGYLIRAIGKKWLLIGCTFLSVVLCCSMYWGTSSNLMLGISSIFVSLTSVTSTAIISVVVDLFPTSLRTMAVSLTMMCGRLGAMTGNLIFPLLLDWDCTVPFFLMAAVLACSGLIAVALPRTKGAALK